MIILWGEGDLTKYIYYERMKKYYEGPGGGGLGGRRYDEGREGGAAGTDQRGGL